MYHQPLSKSLLLSPQTSIILAEGASFIFFLSVVEKLQAWSGIEPTTLDLCSRNQVPWTSLPQQPLFWYYYFMQSIFDPS